MIYDIQPGVWATDEQMKRMVRSQRIRFEGPGRIMIIKEDDLACKHVLQGEVFEGNGIVFED